MRKYISVTILSIALLGISCKNQSSTIDIPADTIVKDIPLNKKGQPYSYYSNKANVENKLGLVTLENGFDSLQIRIWYAYSSMDTSQLVILKYSDKKWVAELIDLVYNMNPSGDTIQSISKLNKSGSPKNGWDLFANNFLALRIDTLPDDSKIANYPSIMDGDNVVVEVATKTKYRIYSYKEPGLAQTKIKEARSIENMLTLIENEFEFPRKRKL